MELIAEQGLTVRRNPRHYEDPLIWRDPTLSPSTRGSALSRIAIHCCFLLLLGANVATVQAQDVGNYGKAPEIPRTGLPEALRTVGFDQNIGDPLPLDAHFLDENGQKCHSCRLLRGETGDSCRWSTTNVRCCAAWF